MPQLVPWHFLMAGIAIAIGTWVIHWVRQRQDLDLSSALDVRWWFWPLARLAIFFWKREAHKDLWEACGWKPYKKTGKCRKWPGSYIFIRRHKGRYWVKIRVAPGFPQGYEEDPNRSRRKQVENQARGKFALGDTQAAWKFRFWHRHVVLTPKKVIPHEAPYADEDVAAQWHARSTADKVVLAIGRGDEPVVHSLDHDAPHILLSASTMGGGKSSTLRNIGVQQYLQGSQLLICDSIKQFSHTKWAIDPTTGQPWPRIVYADTIEEVAENLILTCREMKWRGARVKEADRQGLKPPTFTRLVILLDDVNGVTAELKRHGLTEAIHSLSLLLWAGREVLINIVAAFQRASALAALGGDVRDQFGLRMIAEYQGSAGSNHIVAPQVKLPPCIPHKDQPGWCVFVYGASCFEAQRILMTDAEARALVEAAAQRSEALERVSGNGHVPPTIPPVPAIPAGFDDSHDDGGIEYVTLRRFTERDDVDISLVAIRTCSTTDPNFPKPDPHLFGEKNARLYSERELADWLETRTRTKGDPIVYFIAIGGDLVYGGKVKIGTTTDLKQRLRDMTLHENWVVRTEPGNRKREHELHVQFDDYRCEDDREWFDIEGELAEYLGVSQEVKV